MILFLAFSLLSTFQQPIDGTSLTFTIERDSVTVRAGRWKLKSNPVSELERFVTIHKKRRLTQPRSLFMGLVKPSIKASNLLLNCWKSIIGWILSWKSQTKDLLLPPGKCKRGKRRARTPLTETSYRHQPPSSPQPCRRHQTPLLSYPRHDTPTNAAASPASVTRPDKRHPGASRSPGEQPLARRPAANQTIVSAIKNIL